MVCQIDKWLARILLWVHMVHIRLALLMSVLSAFTICHIPKVVHGTLCCAGWINRRRSELYEIPYMPTIDLIPSQDCSNLATLQGCATLLLFHMRLWQPC